jgi:ElaB/YqjD/DUF883 family membrane-anchored ribosome-binding protein
VDLMAKEREMGMYDGMKEKLSAAKEKIVDLEQNFERKIEDNPIKSVAIAFGVGVLAGAIVTMLVKRNR